MSGVRLTEDQKAVLIEINILSGGSLKAHFPKQAILRHFRKDFRGYAAEALKELVRKGLVMKHPTRGEMTYSLTPVGLQVLRELVR